MNGIEYYRRRSEMTKAELAAKSGLATPIVQKLTTGLRGNTAIYVYQALATALGVTLDDLLAEDYPNTLSARTLPLSRTENPDNCITNYRKSHKLSFSALAKRLGATSRECGRQACARATPLAEHIDRLAAYEGVSVKVFLARYGNLKEGN